MLKLFIMKKITFILMLACILPASLMAQKTTSKSKSATKAKTVKPTTKSTDLPADAYSVTENNAEEKTIETDKQAVVITGSNNKMNLPGTYEKVVITGKNNDITITSVNTIVVTGNGNFVSWEKSSNNTGKPVIKDTGSYNNVGKKSGDALDKNDN